MCVRLSKHQKEFISFFYLSEDKEKEREILESLLYASSSTPPRDIFLFFPRLSFALGRGVVKLFLSDLFSRAREGPRDILLLVFIYFITLSVQPQFLSIFRRYLQFWVISWNVLSCYCLTLVLTGIEIPYWTLFMWNSRFWVMSKCVFNCQTKSRAANLQVKHATLKFLTDISLKL